MVSALGYSRLVHITRDDHQDISNRRDINLLIRHFLMENYKQSNFNFLIKHKGTF